MPDVGTVLITPSVTVVADEAGDYVVYAAPKGRFEALRIKSEETLAGVFERIVANEAKNPKVEYMQILKPGSFNFRLVFGAASLAMAFDYARGTRLQFAPLNEVWRRYSQNPIPDSPVVCVNFIRRSTDQAITPMEVKAAAYQTGPELRPIRHEDTIDFIERMLRPMSAAVAKGFSGGGPSPGGRN